MHELSIAQSLLGIIKEEAAKRGITKVSKVNLVIGEMTEIVPDALVFSFESISEGTVAEGAVLEMEHRPVKAKCQECGETFVIAGYHFKCPKCHSDHLDRVGGDELYIDSFEAEGSPSGEGRSEEKGS